MEMLLQVRQVARGRVQGTQEPPEDEDRLSLPAAIWRGYRF